MIFFRTYNNKLFSVGEVNKLGFSIDNPSYIPDEYLNQQNFTILRTCHGLGDWGIISSFPRKLKEKYPKCKVWIPSPKLLKKMFSILEKEWSSWDDPFQVVHTIFDNNPYVDSFIDSFEGDVYNDHYRIYGKESKIPLLEQMLKFWQFDNFKDIDPELYFTNDEKELAQKIIKEHCNGNFGTLLISNRYEGEGKDLIQQKIDEYDLPMFYWTSTPNSGFNFKKALDLRHVNIRIQLCIKTLATFNIGNQTGVNDTIAKYAPTYTVPRGDVGSNYIKSEIYI